MKNQKTKVAHLLNPYEQSQQLRLINAIDWPDTSNEKVFNDSCWTIRPETDFILNPRKGHHSPKPLIYGLTLDKEAKKERLKKPTTHGLQNFALVIFGNKTYAEVRKQKYTTTCGNPYCMNPKHIKLADMSRPQSHPYYGPVDTKLEQIQKALASPRFDSLADFLNVIRHRATFSDKTHVLKHHKLTEKELEAYEQILLETLLGEGYTWEDLTVALDVADGMRYAKQKRTPNYAANTLREQLREKALQAQDLFTGLNA